MSNTAKYSEYQICIAMLSLYGAVMYVSSMSTAGVVIAASLAVLLGVYMQKPLLALVGSFTNALTLAILSVDYSILSSVAMFYGWFVIVNVSDVKNV